MGVAVLNPQDYLQNHFRSFVSPPPHRVKFQRNSNQNQSRPNKAQSNRRKRSPNGSLSPSPPRAASAAMVYPQPAAPKNLVMGQVKILKRGEPLAAPEKVLSKNDDLDLGSTDRLGPDPELVPTQIRLAESNNSKVNGFYAGSAFVTSPPPSSLPLPAFFMKKSVAGVQNTDDDGTSCLRRILGLSL